MRSCYAHAWCKGGWMLLGLMLITHVTLAQTQVVSGQVRSLSQGTGLEGATVSVAGTTSGVLTGANGSYELSVQPTDTLVCTYVGFETQRVAVGNRTTIDFDMMEAELALDEVVVVGYGRTRKSDVTGAVASVDAETVQQLATPDVIQAIQGRVAGVDITGQSGDPAGGVRIRIRGVGTINNSDPLYVVDGFQTGDISFLNPQDIESMEILKDASATAIYGSRGANGVILITTRRGSEGKPKFHFSSYAGIQEAWNTIDMANAAEYAELRMEAFENDGTTLDPESAEYNMLTFVKEGGYEGTDWQQEVLRRGIIQNYSLSVTGGSRKNRYSLTGTYYDEEGTVKNSEMSKLFLRFTNDLTLADWLKAGISANYVNTQRTYYNTDTYSGILPVALRANPLRAAWDPFENNYGTTGLPEEGANAARAADEIANNLGKREKVLVNLYGEASILKNLTFRSQFGVDISHTNDRNYYGEFYISPEENRDLSSASENRGRSQAWVWSNYMTYDEQFGDHGLNVMAGVEAQASSFTSNRVTAFNIPEDPNQHYLSASKGVNFSVFSNQSEESLASAFGRINYSYASKYLLTVNVRYDGSSRFLPEHRWGLFPSFSAGWNVRNEAFMDQVNFVSELKLRGGWGQVGNQNSAPNYGYVTTVTPDQLYVFNDQIVQGFIPTQLSNPELKWETTEMLNIGVDAGFFDDRLLFTGDFFIKNTRDMIVNVPIPNYVGAAAPRVNAGDMQNIGWEASLNYRQLENDFTYDVSLNFTQILNEVVSLGGGEFIDGGFVGHTGNATRTTEGREIAFFYGLETDGVFNDQAELDSHVGPDGAPIQPAAQLGDVKFIDQNQDGVINEEDRTYLGSGTPDFTAGLNVNLGYKGFDFRGFLQGVYGNEVVNGLSRWIQSSTAWGNMHADRLDRWTPENPTSEEPRMTISDPNRNSDRFSDRFVEDGSYLRLKQVQLGYSLPQSVLDKLSLGSLRVYVAADNLLTFTNYSGWDPEIGELYGNPLYYGVDIANYPQGRIFRMGLDLKF
ncbi:TonB-dependent receptor [Pontibacter sp. G13]|uniref:SusC/RagA family TonB-linked outer membrane protein n=1 Tax=Pontibacter sp. G13 TaxID=3074898 RepID=UPI00288A1C20|nr:TonB-dependent receptor [Pontibacter sp. G13]WNJ21069.1 TonB-dependent receptor [Pontibacter sp. G13]